MTLPSSDCPSLSSGANMPTPSALWSIWVSSDGLLHHLSSTFTAGPADSRCSSSLFLFLSVRAFDFMLSVNYTTTTRSLLLILYFTLFSIQGRGEPGARLQQSLYVKRGTPWRGHPSIIRTQNHSQSHLRTIKSYL